LKSLSLIEGEKMTNFDKEKNRDNDLGFNRSHSGQTPFKEGEWGKNSEFSEKLEAKEVDSKDDGQRKVKNSDSDLRSYNPYVGERFMREHFGLFGDSWGTIRQDLTSQTDKQVYDNVCHALYLSPKVDATKIEVEVLNGIVKLSGLVRNRLMKKDAEACAESILGVKDVRNELQFIN
jgi:hypothetical protein